MKSDFWRILKRYKIREKNSPTVNGRSKQIGLEASWPFKAEIVSEIQHLLNRGVSLYLVYCVDSPSYYNHYLQLRHKAASWEKFRVRLFPDTDHTFTLLANQQSLVNAIHDWVQEVVQFSSSHDAVARVIGDTQTRLSTNLTLAKSPAAARKRLPISAPTNRWLRQFRAKQQFLPLDPLACLVAERSLLSHGKGQHVIPFVQSNPFEKGMFKSNIPRSLLQRQNCWGFQKGLNIPFGRERGSYPDREMPG